MRELILICPKNNSKIVLLTYIIKNKCLKKIIEKNLKLRTCKNSKKIIFKIYH